MLTRIVTACLVIIVTACAAQEATLACDTLLHVDELPMKASYEDVLAQLDIEDTEALQQCLVKNIENSDSIDDPRQAPIVRSYVKGDTAFFLLVRKYGWKIDEFLDDQARESWSQQGVYAYFSYVSNQENRARLAHKVRSRLEQNGN